MQFYYRMCITEATALPRMAEGTGANSNHVVICSYDSERKVTVRAHAVRLRLYEDARRSQAGFTLTELIVIVSIISILIALLIPAVQRVREAANLAQCTNNLRQIGVSIHHHHDTYGRFPSGGWGWTWVGMADRGTGPDQPGGWIYSILSYVEQGALRELGKGEVSPEIEQSILLLLSTPVPQFTCPSRRDGGPYANIDKVYNLGMGTNETTTVKPNRVARSDYAANAGSQGFSQLGGGPSSLADGDMPGYPWSDTSLCSGIFFLRSSVKLQDVTRGSSNTFMVGERYCNSDHYYDGKDHGDNESMYVGFDNDVYRVTFEPPMHDASGSQGGIRFGSAHDTGLNMLYCDGSVRFLSYVIDPSTFFAAGRRSE